ncbi:hypothetical protein [Streptomyces catenulae]|uniref:Uncharacterized protein n=1 Tax=Streptomyces catenulae TaxID=66875 RepID=A0ABV2Z2E7_9ACTN|nr:hypothetical protein [Streptomyces catenulae]
MTTDRTVPTRAELAGLLTEAAHSVSGMLTAESPAASRSYLHPVLGALSAGPRVIGELTDRLESFVAEDLVPATPAGLFTLASYASALGWLTESLAELTASVDQICAHFGIPGDASAPISTPPVDEEQDSEFDFALSASLLAASRITDACREISSGLLEDAGHIRGEATDHVAVSDEPNSLPTLVRSLLARMEAAE